MKKEKDRRKNKMKRLAEGLVFLCLLVSFCLASVHDEPKVEVRVGGSSVSEVRWNNWFLTYQSLRVHSAVSMTYYSVGSRDGLDG